jgi:hypothetical protein
LSEQTFRRVLIGLVCLRLAMMSLLVLGIPSLIVKDGWYFHHGGDQDMMFDAAQSILAGQPKYTYVGAGMPLVMALFIQVFRAETYLDIVVPLVLLNGFLLGSASVVVLAVLARRLTGRRDLALASAALWAVLPYAFYAVFGLHRDAALLRDSYLPLLLWANGLSEAPSLFLYLLGLVLLLAGLDERRGWALAAAGVTFGFAGVIRIHTFAPVGVVFGLLALRRDWRSLALLAGGLLIGYLPQIWYSRGYSGSGIKIPYIQNWLRVEEDGRFYLDIKNTPFAPQFLIANTWGMALRHSELAGVGLAAGAVGLFGFARFWREHGWFRALLLFGSPLFVLFFHALTYVFAADPFRFSVPAFPLLLIAGVYSVAAAVEWLRARRFTRPAGAPARPPAAEIRKAPGPGS